MCSAVCRREGGRERASKIYIHREGAREGERESEGEREMYIEREEEREGEECT